MPEMNGYETIAILKDDHTLAHIPIIFLTAKSDIDNELTGLSLGAVDYISKPFSPPLLLKRIELHLLVVSQRQELIDFNNNLQQKVNEKTKTVVELQNALLTAMAELVECRDCVTGGHIERTQSYLRILINELMESHIYQDDVSQWDVDLIVQSAQMHDVGKIVIDDIILRKPGKLTREEFEKIKKHTSFGEQVINKIKKSTSEQAFLEQARILAYTHHEKWDGSGYPHGLSGQNIPLQGRLMAIADVYDALVSVRPYKKAFPHQKAVDIIHKESGSHFDPALVTLFLRVADKFENVTKEFGATAKEFDYTDSYNMYESQRYSS
jgi:putative two-component system response regulator